MRFYLSISFLDRCGCTTRYGGEMTESIDMDSTFWQEMWQSAIENSPIGHHKKKDATIRRWDKMAEWFSKRTASSEADDRRRKIIEMLKNEGALGPSSTVLDIGAGPGSWAVPLSREAAHVVALEPSGEMIKRLESRIRQEGIENIDVVCRLWEEIDLEEEGWINQFDLVFASMTPGVRDPDSLKKVIDASKGFCYLSRFSGQGWRKSYSELWEAIFGEGIGTNPTDIIYPFNMVYAMGYKPNLHFNYWRHTREEPVDEAVENILLFFEDHVETDENIREQVKNYVMNHSVEGVYSQDREVCQGIMFWNVQSVR